MSSQIAIPLFPLHAVLFPGMPLALQIFESRYMEMLAACLRQNLPFGVVLIRTGDEVGGQAVPHPVGTTARIASMDKRTDGRILLGAVGEERFRILDLEHGRPYLMGRVELWPDEAGDASLEPVRRLFSRYLVHQREPGEEVPELPAAAGRLSWLVAAAMPWSSGEKQALLELPGAAARLEREAGLLKRDLAVVRFLQRMPAGSDSELN